MARVGSETDRDQAAEQTEPQPVMEDSIGRANRRAFPRHAVDCPVTVIPVGGIGQMAGQLSDLSMGGCLVRLGQRYLAGMLVRVEVQFQLRGIGFRILGVTVGTRGAQSFAIRFVDVPDRRREELAEVLKEIAAINAIKAEISIEEDAASQQAPESGISVKPAEAVEPVMREELSGEVLALSAVNLASHGTEEAETERQMAQAAAGLLAGRNVTVATARERRIHSRHAVDTSVRLLLIKSAIAMTGRIANLSVGGCRIRTDERFNVGIFVRVEAEFYLHGLPFRIAGVSQAIQDRNTIGIRFLDMSERCRAQLVELIAEIEEDDTLEGDEPEGSSPAR
jgi:hypothetical protein